MKLSRSSCACLSASATTLSSLAGQPIVRCTASKVSSGSEWWKDESSATRVLSSESIASWCCSSSTEHEARYSFMAVTSSALVELTASFEWIVSYLLLISSEIASSSFATSPPTPTASARAFSASASLSSEHWTSSRRQCTSAGHAAPARCAVLRHLVMAVL